MRRLPIVGLVLVALAAILGAASAASAQPTSGQPVATPASEVLIVKVTGLLDPNLAQFVESQIADAERVGAIVVLQVKSGTSVLSDAQFQRLASSVRDAKTPIFAWVGPKASVRGRVAQLVSLTSVVGISADSRLGDLGEIVVDGGDFGGKVAKLPTETVNSSEAVALGIALDAPVIGNFIVDLPGVETRVVDTDRKSVV